MGIVIVLAMIKDLLQDPKLRSSTLLFWIWYQQIHPPCKKSLTKVKTLYFEHEQNFCIYPCDQQLYCIAASILWHNTELANDFYLR